MEIDANRRSVKQVFTSGDQIEVPPYQRPYAWTSSEIDQLWADLVEAGEDGYFLGPLVIFRDNERQKRLVIDGQQRLTTLQILLALVRDRYVEMGSPKYRNPNSLIHTAEYAVGDDQFRLKSGRANWRILRDCILREPSDSARLDLANPSTKKAVPTIEWKRNKNLLNARSRLLRLLDEHLKQASDPERALEAIDDLLAKRVDLVAIEVTGLADAFLLFETLNDRGLRLSAADLLKSHLLRRFDEQVRDDGQVEAAATEWDELVDTLGGGDMTRFLRHYLLATNEKVRKSDIYDLFVQETRKVGPQQMLSDLQLMGDYYSQFLDPGTVSDVKIADALRDLRDTGVVTHYVALLPARRYLQDRDFLAFGRLCERLSFRWFVCGLNAQELESVYQAAADILTRSKGGQLDEASATLTSKLPSDDQFFARFRTQAMGVKYVARYALRKLEGALRSRSEFTIKPAFEVHIEHIMPVTPTDYWTQRAPEDTDYQEAVARWGNLTLLHQAPNQEIQNGPWSVKRDEYRRSDALITRELAELDSWDANHVEKRQDWMGLLALNVWGTSRSTPIPSYLEFLEDPEAYGLARSLQTSSAEASSGLSGSAS
jgi:hypothetical protein